MSRPWDPALRRVRRRAIRAATVEAIGRFSVPIAILSVGYFLLTRWSPWARFLAPYVGAATGLLLLAVWILARVRGRKSAGYYAKLLDRESKLDDRLTSSVEWIALPEPSPFQARCIEQLSLELRARNWRLIEPKLHARRRGLTSLSLLLLAAVVAAHVWQPAPVFEVDSHRKLQLSAPVLQRAGGESQALRAEVTPLADPELEQAASDLAQLVQSLGESRTDKETSLAEIERLAARVAAIRQRTPGLDQIGGGDVGGPVGALGHALAQGDAKAVDAAISQVASALAQGGLSDEEIAELQTAVATLGALAKQSGAGPVSSAMRQVAEQLQGGNQAAAGKALADASQGLAPLRKPLAAFAAARRAEAVLAALRTAAAGTTGPATAAETANPFDQPPSSKLRVSPGDTPGVTSAKLTPFTPDGPVGASAARGSDERTAPSPAETPRGAELQLHGAWNGKVVRQLFDNSGSGGASDDAKRLLVDHERVVEDRFLHDDVPSEYQEAVRAYFAALHQRERQWTQTRK